ncbi:hypothetical protein BC835DRAFT_677514 [Cytidiella melzeri]|nr:hypothetical protein BC835DRAFT_677514 [Cytidiella melzeri]
MLDHRQARNCGRSEHSHAGARWVGSIIPNRQFGRWTLNGQSAIWRLPIAQRAFCSHYTHPSPPLFVPAMLTVTPRYQNTHTFGQYPDLVDTTWFMVPASSWPSCLYPKGQAGRVNLKFNGELGVKLAASLCEGALKGITADQIFPYKIHEHLDPLRLRVKWPGYLAKMYEIPIGYSMKDQRENCKLWLSIIGLLVRCYLEEQSRTSLIYDDEDDWWLGRFSIEDVRILAVEHVEDLNCKEGEQPKLIFQPILGARMRAKEETFFYRSGNA